MTVRTPREPVNDASSCCGVGIAISLAISALTGIREAFIDLPSDLYPQYHHLFVFERSAVFGSCLTSSKLSGTAHNVMLLAKSLQAGQSFHRYVLPPLS